MIPTRLPLNNMAESPLISAQGFICGRYKDAFGIARGFLARAKGIPSANEAGTLATPLNPAPSGSGT
jgi:hypothetical protein